nr:MAG TPA: hypothetical protein [Podoviridae sp. ctK5Q1]
MDSTRTRDNEVRRFRRVSRQINRSARFLA